MSEENVSVNGDLKKRSESIAELATALSKAQGEIKGAVKDSNNPFFKSSYADLASVWDACRGPLAKNAIAVIQCPRTNQEGIEVETILAHSSGQWISETLTIPVQKRDAQSLGSAITYARRYALASFVGVAPEDDDGNAASRQDASKNAQQAQGSISNEPVRETARKKKKEAPADPTQGNQWENSWHLEIAKKQTLCNELFALPIFDWDRDNKSKSGKTMYETINRTDHSLESISDILRILKDQSEIRLKAQKAADKRDGLEVTDADLPLLNNIESSTEAF